jgi:hypothetical protein
MSTPELTSTHLEYHGQPYARVDLNPCQSRLYSQVRDEGFGLSVEDLTQIRPFKFLVREPCSVPPGSRIRVLLLSKAL